MSDDLQNTIFQKRTWKGINHLTLREGRNLKVQQSSKLKSVSYMIDLIALDKKSRRVYSLAWGWFLTAVIFSLLSYISIQYPDLLNGVGQYYSLGLTVLVIICTMGCFIFFWLSSSRKQVFYSRHGKVPLFEVWVGQPTGKAFRAYVKLLKEHIQQIQERSSLSEEQQLTGEIKMLRRLVDENVVNKAVYEKTKARLFKKF